MGPWVSGGLEGWLDDWVGGGRRWSRVGSERKGGGGSVVGGRGGGIEGGN